MTQSSIDIGILLTADVETPAFSIPSVLGDGFLCQESTVYRNVRRCALDDGFTFTVEPTDELWCSYQLMSLACLDEIMAAKQFPCFPNKRALERLRRSDAGPLSLSPQFLLLALTRNNHFHEASHALGYIVLKQQKAFSHLDDLGGSLRVWGSLFTEAIASTVEFVAWMASKTKLERLFLKLNSPSSYEDHDLRMFGRFVLDQYGIAFMFERVFFSFLMARLYNDFLSEEQQKRLSDVFAEDEPGTPRKRLGDILLRTAKGLRADFRDVVAPAYFDILGLHDQYANIVAQGLNLEAYGHELRSYARDCATLSCRDLEYPM